MPRLVAIDVESHKIVPGLLAPPLVCVTFAEEGEPALLLDKRRGTEMVRSLLHSGAHLVLHNGSFDLAVICAYDPSLIPAVFRAFEDGRIWDTKIREELKDIAEGRDKNGFVRREGKWARPVYTLAGLVWRYLNKDRSLEKSDPNAWRVRFGELDGVPVEDWPQEAADYALEDATDTLEVFAAQGGIEGALPTEQDQVRAAWALHLMSVWGLRTDAEHIGPLTEKLEAEQERVRRKLKACGLVVPKRATAQEARDGKAEWWEADKRGKPKPMRWAKDSKKLESYVERVYARQGKTPPRTESGRIATDKQTLYDSGSRLLTLVADGGGVDKLIGTYLPVIEQGTKVPVQARFNPLVNTGRTSCIAKGTLIEIVRDVSKYPNGVPIEEVRPGDLAYCFDEEGRLAIRKVTWAGKTGTKNVVRVVWRAVGKDGRRMGHLDCTPDHHIRLSDGKYVEAQYLQAGASVQSLTRGMAQGYARLWATGGQHISREHRFVYEQTSGKRAAHVHHKNENRLDNRPENLEGMTAAEHISLHSRNPSPELSAKRSAAMRRRFAEGHRNHIKRGAEHPRWLGLSREWIEKELWEAKGKPTAVCQKHGIDYDTFKKYCRREGIRFQDIARHFDAHGNRIDLNFVKDRRKNFETMPYKDALATTGMNYYKWAEVQVAHGFDVPYNHNVVAVEPLEGEVDVYDLTVEDTHNYIAGELCVHNCSNPNLQNLPSGRRIGGIRESFVPRAGYVYGSVDYDTLELRALAQVCLKVFGESRMAEVINDDKDLHSALAADMVRVPYEQIEAGKKVKGSQEKKGRDAAKVGNFGIPGGLGAKSLVEYAKAGYGVILSEAQARDLKNDWLRTWPEMNYYFQWINSLVGFGDAVIEHPITGFIRGNVGYTDGCNHMFQHLAAMGAKRALFRVAKECYTDCGTPLFGTRPVAFIHDEILAEFPEHNAHEAAFRMAEVMCEAMATLIPDVKITATPALMRRWWKDATDVYDERGRLIPWEPKKN